MQELKRKGGLILVQDVGAVVPRMGRQVQPQIGSALDG